MGDILFVICMLGLLLVSKKSILIAQPVNNNEDAGEAGGRGEGFDDDILTNEIAQNRTGSNFIPQFMLDLYNVVADEHGIMREGAPYLGKTINCIFAQESPKKADPGHFIYRFNLSSVNEHEDIRRVELRVFKTKTKNLRHQGKRFYRTDVIFKTKTFTKGRATMVSSAGYGWLPFDVTDICKQYFRHKDDFLDIDVAVRPIRQKLPDFKFLMSTNSSLRALLIIYSDTKLKLNFPLVTLSKTNTKPSDEFLEFLLEPSKHKKHHRHRSKRSMFSERKWCQRKNLKIDFRKHQELRDIVTPHIANIYRCAGSCMFPFGKGAITEETNHAALTKLVVQKRMEKKNKHSLQNKFPCCSPKKLKSMSLLYQKPNSDYIEMRTLDKAIVASCWCT